MKLFVVINHFIKKKDKVKLLFNRLYNRTKNKNLIDLFLFCFLIEFNFLLNTKNNNENRDFLFIY